MKNLNQFQRMAFMVQLLKRKPHGSASELAKKLNISRRTFFRYAEELGMHGAEIKYRKSDNCYYIDNDFCFFENYLKNVM
jgi:predicted DNA-binding transcriptional regulator YafY